MSDSLVSVNIQRKLQKEAGMDFFSEDITENLLNRHRFLQTS